MSLAQFPGQSDEDDDSFSAVGWTNYPDDGWVDDADELASEPVVSIQVVEESSSVLGETVFQTSSQGEDHSQRSSASKQN